MANAVLYSGQPEPEMKPANISTIRAKKADSDCPHLARGQRAVREVISKIEEWSGEEARRRGH